MAELAVERADAAAPAAPFVEIAHHEYRGVDRAVLRHFRRAVAGERTEQPARLRPPLAAAQPEMRRDDAQHLASFCSSRRSAARHPLARDPVVDGEIDVEGAARLAARHAEIDVARREDGKPRQDGVAEAAAAIAAVRSGDDLQSGLLGEKRRLIGQLSAVALSADLLQRDDVGAKLAQYGGDARRIVTAVGADTGVNVVGRDDEARPALGVRARRRPGQAACAPPPGVPQHALPVLGDLAQSAAHSRHVCPTQ